MTLCNHGEPVVNGLTACMQCIRDTEITNQRMGWEKQPKFPEHQLLVRIKKKDDLPTLLKYDPTISAFV